MPTITAIVCLGCRNIGERNGRKQKKKKTKGILTGKNQRFKISQLADDTALGVESEEEINEVEKTIQHFEKESGARLNRVKTCAMELGEWNKRDTTGQSFKVARDSCDVTHSLTQARIHTSHVHA